MADSPAAPLTKAALGEAGESTVRSGGRATKKINVLAAVELKTTALDVYISIESEYPMHPWLTLLSRQLEKHCRHHRA